MDTISIEHGDRLFWLGRYAERAFTTLCALETLYDRGIDSNPDSYTGYLSRLGFENTYKDGVDFFESFIFNKDNPGSVAACLTRAYDNGIVLREEISTEALSFLQMAMDKLDEARDNGMSLRLAMLPIQDILYGFWGCINDYVFNHEIINIIYCGKYVERLDLYLRLDYPFHKIEREFKRLCEHLQRVPKNTPYRYNTKQLCTLVDILNTDSYNGHSESAVFALERLFERSEPIAS